MITRRHFILTVAALPAMVHAQTGTTRIVVGYPAGGVVDVTARALAEGLRALIGGVIVVDNRTGAGGTIAALAVKAAPPDGQTLLYSPPSVFTVRPHVYKDLRYDPFADFVPVSTVCSYPFALAVAPSVPAKTLAQFLAWAKANPKEAAYASPGAGSIQAFMGAMLARAAGAPMTHVPYKGAAQSINDVMAGTIASAVGVAQLYTPYHRAGKLRVLAVSGRARLASLPEVPTFAEEGYPSLTFEEWFGVFAPARTPDEVADKLAKAVAAAVASPVVKDVLAKLDYAPHVSVRADFAKMLRAQYDRWGNIVRETGFKPL